MKTVRLQDDEYEWLVRNVNGIIEGGTYSVTSTPDESPDFLQDIDGEPSIRQEVLMAMNVRDRLKEAEART